MNNQSKIAIVGLGIEGIANYNYFKNLASEIKIFDEYAKENDTFDGKTILNSFSKIPDDFVAVRSPGISLNNLQTKTNAIIWSGTNEFMKKVREIKNVTVIGVTGTKGKGTTCSMIAAILKSLGKNVHLVGNIGVPALQEINKIKPGDFVVYEMSSFQLWDLEIENTPDIAVLTNLEQDHLDVHSDFEEYKAAKNRIFNDQNRLPITEIESKFVVDLAKATKLPGLHNFENAKMAVASVLCALKMSGIISRNSDLTDADKMAINSALNDFQGLDHRLKKVHEIEIDGKIIEFFDDSIATTPGSVIAAIGAIDIPKVIMLGGKDKGADYSVLIEPINNGNIEKVIIYGENSSTIYDALNSSKLQQNKLKRISAKTMHEVVNEAFQAAISSETDRVAIILSPAAASFDMFKNYSDRGNQFIEAAKSLSSKNSKLLIFDSGKGGQFVADRLKTLRPNDEFIVINDCENVPYGNKTKEQVHQLTRKKILPHINNVDVIVIACNTATALAIDDLRKEFQDQLFVGFEPMIKPAATKSSTKSIAVLATPATLNSARYRTLVEKYAHGFKVFEPDCKDWAEKIENATFEKSDLRELIELVSLESIDQVILACTHYLGIEDLLRQCLPNSIKILEPINAINRRITQILH